jgi:hypothetical protein
MALLKAFFDASKTEPEGVTSIGGYVGTEQQWTNTEATWLEYLHLWGLDEFHMAPLLSGNTHLGRENGELCALSFARIIQKSRLHGIGAALNDIDWSRYASRDAVYARRYPQAYHACFDNLLSVLADHMRLEFPADAVAVVMDSDAPPQAAYAIFDEWKTRSRGQLVTVAFSNREVFRVLECADLRAGEDRKAWLNAQSWTRPETSQIYDIAQGERSRGSYWSAETEREIVAILDRLRKEKEGRDGEG